MPSKLKLMAGWILIIIVSLSTFADGRLYNELKRFLVAKKIIPQAILSSTTGYQ